mmetsp:Transcript_16960/g.24915  ORF Transcript_16960/g.24915 Transcript_16960/m.24915 type:complete len:100 (-) Transcript_16960:28-327(-)
MVQVGFCLGDAGFLELGTPFLCIHVGNLVRFGGCRPRASYALIRRISSSTGRRGAALVLIFLLESSAAKINETSSQNAQVAFNKSTHASLRIQGSFSQY